MKPDFATEILDDRELLTDIAKLLGGETLGFASSRQVRSMIADQVDGLRLARSLVGRTAEEAAMSCTGYLSHRLGLIRRELP